MVKLLCAFALYGYCSNVEKKIKPAVVKQKNTVKQKKSPGNSNDNKPPGNSNDNKPDNNQSVDENYIQSLGDDYIHQDHDPHSEYYKLAEEAIQSELNLDLWINKLLTKIGVVKIDDYVYEFGTEELLIFYEKAIESLRFKDNLSKEKIRDLTLELLKDKAAACKFFSLSPESQISVNHKVQEYSKEQRVNLNQLSKFIYESEQQKRTFTDIYKIKIAMFSNKHDAQTVVDLYKSNQLTFKNIIESENQINTSAKYSNIITNGELNVKRKDDYVDLGHIYNSAFN